MDMSGEEQIPASREQVWKALNNPNILKRCIPGCEGLEAKSPTEMVATIKVKFGPISRNFKSQIKIVNINEPESYTIESEGGIAKATTDVVLREQDGNTVLSYTVKGKVGGKFAILGSSLVQSSANKIMTQFFTKLKKIISARAAQAAESSEA
jgi:hypothetical protein